MLSSLTSWDVGTTGGLSGTYALKVPTLPLAGSKVFAQKRLGSPWRGKFRVETWFCFKADPSDFQLGETDIRALYLTFDVMDAHHIEEQRQKPGRWWPALRYHNAENGQLVRKWQANVGSEGVKDGAWEYLADGQQDLGYNRAATKYRWSYLRFYFDLARHEYVDSTVTGRSSTCRAGGMSRTRLSKAAARAPTNAPASSAPASASRRRPTNAVSSISTAS